MTGVGCLQLKPECLRLLSAVPAERQEKAVGAHNCLPPLKGYCTGKKGSGHREAAVGKLLPKADKSFLRMILRQTPYFTVSRDERLAQSLVESERTFLETNVKSTKKGASDQRANA